MGLITMSTQFAAYGVFIALIIFVLGALWLLMPYTCPKCGSSDTSDMEEMINCFHCESCGNVFTKY